MSRFDLELSMYFISINMVGFRQAICFLYKLNGAFHLSLDQIWLGVSRMSGNWCSVSISTAPGRR